MSSLIYGSINSLVKTGSEHTKLQMKTEMIQPKIPQDSGVRFIFIGVGTTNIFVCLGG